MIPWPSVFTSKTLWIVAGAAAYTSAVFWAGHESAGKGYAEDRADELTALIAQSADMLRASNTIETEGREREEGIRNVRARAVIEIDPAGCKLSDPERVRFNERVALRNAFANLAASMPGILPSIEGNVTERDD